MKPLGFLILETDFSKKLLQNLIFNVYISILQRSSRLFLSMTWKPPIEVSGCNSKLLFTITNVTAGFRSDSRFWDDNSDMRFFSPCYNRLLLAGDRNFS